MPKPLPTLITAPEIRALVERALDLLAAYAGDDEEDDDSPLDEPPDEQQRHLAYRAAKEALRFGAAAAAQLGDPGLVPVVVAALKEQRHWNPHSEDDKETVMTGLSGLLRVGAPVTPEIEELASSGDADLRASVAQGLRPRDRQAIALLSKLAVDPVVEVRKPAKEALAARGEVPWWFGKFESDPAARLSVEEATRHKAALEQLSALLDAPSLLVRDREQEIVDLIASLPDLLAVEVSARVLSGRKGFGEPLGKLGAVMLARPGGVEALIEVCQSWGSEGFVFLHAEHVAMFAELPRPRREEVCVTLARWAAEQPPAKGRDAMGKPGSLAASLAGKAFPPGADLTPLLDIVLGRPAKEEHDLDWVVAGLRDAFVHPEASPGPIAARCVEALLAGFPGAWSPIATAIHELLRKLPRDELRVAAEAAARCDKDHTRRWGLTRLLFDAHDPARDPEPLEMARRFFDEPRFRSVVFDSGDLQHAVAAHARAALRRGELELTDAARTVSSIAALWGGLTSSRVRHGVASPEQEEQELATLRGKLAAFLGPEELHGPLDERDWEALRRARAAQSIWEDRHHVQALTTLPPGPWHPEDRVVIERAVAACEAGSPIAYFVAAALGDKASAQDLPLFPRLAKVARDDRRWIREAYQKVRAALGDEVPKAALDGALDWMDEPEDDED